MSTEPTADPLYAPMGVVAVLAGVMLLLDVNGVVEGVLSLPRPQQGRLMSAPQQVRYLFGGAMALVGVVFVVVAFTLHR
jgi:hypothetical protein